MTTLIRLAAAVTLLFTAFYISDFNHRSHSDRWAESIGQSGYVNVGEAGVDQYMIPMSIGFNTLLSPAAETDRENNTIPEGTEQE